jgi:hypothetical protein
MKNLLLILLAFVFINQNIFSQEDSSYVDDSYDSSSIEVFLIDAYVKQEPPYIFILSFYTSDVCKSSVLIDGKYNYEVSKELIDNHNANIDLTNLSFATKNINFVIETTDSLGNKSVSEEFEFDLPYEPNIQQGSSIWTLCLFAGSVFLLPMPGYVNADGENYYSITKELPLISFRAKKGNYPNGYIAAEYTHILDAKYKNFGRLGYKQIFPIDYIEYISPGLTAYTNFKGQNGIAPEISVGWFTMFNTFTVYTRYRYNIKPNDSDANLHEINLGLYTRFFSLYF